ncbi:hypothetical protein [Mycobacteroides abscessus]|uniref:hypothetical protein n=1 Tax=Mycobacteroides abscessus TaxID=36809 RepID=UPI001F2AD5FA|nr:hypothetical protein [Mycobacteroides abscessus]
MPETPGVMPVLAGICEDPGEVGAVGSWWVVAELTAVVMLSAAAGTLGKEMLGILGRPVDLVGWCCPVGWCPCAPWPAGVLVVVLLGDLALGEDGVPDGLALPAMSPARVGFVMCGLAVGVGVLGVLDDSVVGESTARGISGS